MTFLYSTDVLIKDGRREDGDISPSVRLAGHMQFAAWGREVEVVEGLRTENDGDECCNVESRILSCALVIGSVVSMNSGRQEDDSRPLRHAQHN